MNTKALAKYYASGRIGIGLLLLLFPGRVLQGMLGGPDMVTPGAKMLGRMLGVRDAILGVGALTSIDNASVDNASAGGDQQPQQKRWTTYAAVADATDALAMLLAYRSLPKRKRFAMVVLAASGAATGGYLLTASSA